MNEKNDAVITWISGDGFCQLKELWIFIESLDRCGFQGRKIVLTHDMNLKTEIELKKRNYEVINVEPKYVISVLRDRHIFYRKFLIDNPNIRYAILVDSKDVYFQENPISLIEELDYDLFLISEGITFEQSEWNKSDIIKYLRNIKYFNKFYFDWDVINGGTIIGKNKDIINLCLNIWTNHLISDLTSTDQAVLNYLVRQLIEVPSYKIIYPHDCNLVLTGEAVKQGFFKPEIVNNKIICPKNKKPYRLFHQWERTEFAPIIEGLFSEES